MPSVWVFVAAAFTYPYELRQSHGKYPSATNAFKTHLITLSRVTQQLISIIEFM
jgi:hypothetical protein